MNSPQPISIWQPEYRQGELYFVRPEPLPLGDHYAAQRLIRAHKDAGQKRICFFGESVAAGYLYAPHLTPAKWLSQQLQWLTADSLFEVVDLARTNEMLTTLVQTVAQAMQLQPDMLIIFAGNNWNLLETPEASPYYPSLAGRRAFAETWQAQGLWGPIELAAKQRLEKAGSALAQIGAIATAAQIPVVLIVPEVNLADWETRQPVSWLPGDGSARWHHLYQQAVSALQVQAWETAVSHTNQILDLDQGTCPATFRLLAYAQLGGGSRAKAKIAARAEVNSNHYASLCFLGAPQATMLDQELLRRAAQQHGFGLVDLPKIFEQYTEGEIPGRRLFLDYCHLTGEGIHVAMAATAVTVLQHFFPESTVPSWSEWVADSPPPTLPDETEAAVFLGAAMHTAHRLFPIRPEHDIIAHWLTTALHTAPAITSAMLALAEMRRSPIPTLLTAAQQRNFDSPFRLGFQHGLDYAHIDAVLLAEMHKSLAQIAPGEAAKFNEILSAQPDGETAELIFPPYYLWQPLCRFYPEVMEVADQTQMAYLRVPWPNISFAFLVTSSRNLRLSITARLPLYEDIVKGWKGKMMVEVNGRSLTTAPLKQRWQQISLSVDHHFLQPGLNKLTVRWPALPPIGSEMIAKASTRLRQGLPATIHPIFGELYSIKVKPV